MDLRWREEQHATAMFSTRTLLTACSLWVLSSSLTRTEPSTASTTTGIDADRNLSIDGAQQNTTAPATTLLFSSTTSPSDGSCELCSFNGVCVDDHNQTCQCFEGFAGKWNVYVDIYFVCFFFGRGGILKSITTHYNSIPTAPTLLF